MFAGNLGMCGMFRGISAIEVGDGLLKFTMLLLVL